MEKAKNTVTAIFPGIGKIEISKERAEQIKRLQKIMRDNHPLNISNKNQS